MGALGHDAGHFAASHNSPVLNEWGVWAMTLICNPILWQQQHTYGHHSYTNEFGHDPDLHHFHLCYYHHRRCLVVDEVVVVAVVDVVDDS